MRCAFCPGVFAVFARQVGRDELGVIHGHDSVALVAKVAAKKGGLGAASPAAVGKDDEWAERRAFVRIPDLAGKYPAARRIVRLDGAHANGKRSGNERIVS
jgi:hypothetical protein